MQPFIVTYVSAHHIMNIRFYSSQNFVAVVVVVAVAVAVAVVVVVAVASISE